MLLNEEEQKKTSKIKISTNQKIIKKNNNFKYYKGSLKNYKSYYNNDNDEEKISLIEHQNILNEYKNELKFLNMKRKKEDSYENINNNTNGKPNNNQNIVICVDNKELNQNCNKKNYEPHKKDGKSSANINGNVDMKISKLHNIYHYLFEKNGLECNTPSRLVDYLSNNIDNNNINNNNFNFPNKDKLNFDDIKKLINSLENEDIENILINKLIKQYFHCTFKHSVIQKLITKINKYIINGNKNNNIKHTDNLEIANDINSMSINIDTFEKNSKNKKDRHLYSNLLDEKLKNNYESCLSLTNDLDYFKSIIYLSNKYILNKNKKGLSDKTLIKPLEANRDLLKSYKAENQYNSNQCDKKYLNNLLKNKKLRKYINNKLFCFKESFKNGILNSLDKYKFNEIINILISNKKEEKEKLKILNEFYLSKKVKKNDIINFLTLVSFISCIIIINKNTNQDLLLKSDLALLNPLFKYFNKFDNFPNLELKPKKKIKIKKINENKKNNKIRIKLEDENNSETIINNPQDKIEESKIEEENKEEQGKIIKIILDNNDITLYDENQNNKTIKNNNKTIHTNEFLTMKLPSSTEDNSIIKNEKNNNIKDYNQNNFKYNLIKKNINSKFGIRNKTQNNLDKKFQLIHKRLLKQLSQGNDIFKLKYAKIKEREKRTEIDEEKDKIYGNNQINIEIKEETTKIKNGNNLMKENNYNNMENHFLKKNGNTIIIYDDEYFEENKNDSNNENSDKNISEKEHSNY